MSTQHQRSTYLDLLASGQAATQRQAVERYISRAGIATTKMVANFLSTPLSTATGRLDELASLGRVIKAETAGGKTGWKYIRDREDWPEYARLYRLRKVRRNIDRLIRADEDNFLPSNLINRLKLAGNDLDTVLADNPAPAGETGQG